MQYSTKQAEEMTLQETLDAVQNLKQKMEDNFIQLGQLLAMVKAKKLYKKKGYDTFKEFVEAEYKINGTLAAKLCSVYDVFITDMDLDEETMKSIGFDRLTMVKPYVAKSDPFGKDDWVEKADSMPIVDLKEHIKQLKNQEKNKEKTLKDVLVDQYLERMTTWFNCSAKELSYKLALYFQDADLEEVRKIVKDRQKKFETSQTGEEA